jgi:hypothetical protein
MDGSIFTSAFFWAQCFGLIAMAINILSWQMKNPRWIIFSYCPANTCWAIQYLLLGAPLGVVMNACSAVKDGALAFIRQSYVPYLIGTLLLSIWSIGLYYLEQWFDVLPLLAGTIINLALLQRENRGLLARACITAQVCWITYNLIVGSYMGAINGVFVSTSCIIGMARHEAWVLGRCHRTFMPSIARALFVFPNFRTYP